MTGSDDRITRRGLIAGAAAAGLALATTPEALTPQGLALAAAGSGTATPPPPADALAGWSPASPRDELRPRFELSPTGGPGGGPCLVIESDSREGLDGCWTRTFPVTGGRHY